MIDGARRGFQAGSEVARRFPCTFTDAELAELACFVLRLMKRRGDAHLEPEPQFLQAFPQGFHMHQVLRGCPSSIGASYCVKEST